MFDNLRRGPRGCHYLIFSSAMVRLFQRQEMLGRHVDDPPLCTPPTGTIYFLYVLQQSRREGECRTYLLLTSVLFTLNCLHLILSATAVKRIACLRRTRLQTAC